MVLVYIYAFSILSSFYGVALLLLRMSLAPKTQHVTRKPVWRSAAFVCVKLRGRRVERREDLKRGRFVTIDTHQRVQSQARDVV